MESSSVLRFTKMHGIGNDYIYLDAITAPEIARRTDLPALARAMSDRHTGVGADGLIVIHRPDKLAGGSAGAESCVGMDSCVGMRMFNADGSEAEMCGNGLRCVVKYAVDHALVTPEANALCVGTGAGVLEVRYELTEGKVSAVTVDMGKPLLAPHEIPVNTEAPGGDASPDGAPGVGRLGVSYRLTILRDQTPECAHAPVELEAVLVSMGNPHAVIFLESQENVAQYDVAGLGPLIEHHPAFPQRINAHFVEVVQRGEVIMRTWERGTGITRACGTGAAAVCVAGVLRDLTDRALLVHLPGGDLHLAWDARNQHVFMTGPAIEVFTGIWPG